MILKGRCGECDLFPGNGKVCKNDILKRGKLHANDYQCRMVK